MTGRPDEREVVTTAEGVAQPPALNTIDANTNSTSPAPPAAAAPLSVPDAVPTFATPAVAQTAADSTQQPHVPVPPKTILVLDVGGTKVKMLATGQTEPIKFASGPEFTPARLVETVQKLTKGWEFEAISMGYPGLVGSQGPRSEPGNLGSGWVGFDFAAAFGKPVKMINDAALQALGGYEGGRMLFLGLGTGLGSTLITGHMIIPLELGRLVYSRNRTIGEVLGRQGLARQGKTRWRKAVTRVVTALMHAFLADYVVIGGGNAKLVEDLPPGARRGNNLTAFRGGARLWSIDDVWVLAVPGEEIPEPFPQEPLRMQ